MSGTFDSTASRRSSARDPLTHAFTRSYFLSLLSAERSFALDMGTPFVVCLVDIDQLRKLNAESGFDRGDGFIAAATETVRGTLDQPQWHNLRCLIGRYDGDCLILLLPSCRLLRAEQFAHAVRRRIAHIGQEAAGITASVAVAAFKADDTIDSLMARTEKTLCLAKQFGGNSVEVSRTAELTRELASVTRLPVPWCGRPKRSA
jgi:diguanylate cyclase (GGDEF)-like protein